jgi:hypothetical protein
MSRPERAADDVRHIRVHPRTRLALLEEIAADVDALEDELVARGLTRAHARAAAVGCLYPGPEAARELEVDHAAYRRFAERVGGDRLARLERAALGLVGILTMAGLAVTLGRLETLRGAGPFLWGAIAATSLLVANTVRVAFCLWVRQDMRAAERRTARRVQMGLVLLIGSLCVAGSAAEAYDAAGRLEASPDWATGFAMLRDIMALLALGLGAVVIGLTGWQAVTPSLYRYESLEQRVANVFVASGPRRFGERRPHLGSPPLPSEHTDGSKTPGLEMLR